MSYVHKNQAMNEIFVVLLFIILLLHSEHVANTYVMCGNSNDYRADKRSENLHGLVKRW